MSCAPGPRPPDLVGHVHHAQSCPGSSACSQGLGVAAEVQYKGRQSEQPCLERGKKGGGESSTKSRRAKASPGGRCLSPLLPGHLSLHESRLPLDVVRKELMCRLPLFEPPSCEEQKNQDDSSVDAPVLIHRHPYPVYEAKVNNPSAESSRSYSKSKAHFFTSHHTRNSLELQLSRSPSPTPRHGKYGQSHVLAKSPIHPKCWATRLLVEMRCRQMQREGCPPIRHQIHPTSKL
ncbi:hypothetical protein GQ53DRAFT_191072 [Thozetella sp. PMI_491]|nr:hypothetical protein GQ53DRAFT_191072 [Thozetella sp. PMI_491]